MDRRRPKRLNGLHGIGVDKMGNIADKKQDDSSKNDSTRKLLRLENLDVDIAPDAIVQFISAHAATNDDDNSYLPFLGQIGLRDAVAKHVSSLAKGAIEYDGEKNCVISAGGLSGILNALLATVEEGDGVLLTAPAYAGLINRVHLAGGIPRFVPFNFKPGASWGLDREQLRQVVENKDNRITTMLLMSPCMPTGTYLTHEYWTIVAELCVKHEILLIYDSAMERLLFDELPVIHPASFPGMAERTITVGSASKELRMIGWRVGWIVGPENIMRDIGLVSMANVVVPVGLAQRAVEAALQKSQSTMPAYVHELQLRRDLCMKELEGLPFGRPDGGWSLLLRVDELGWTADAAAEALLKAGACMTPMIGWGTDDKVQYVRIVFSNEPRERLLGLGKIVRNALSTLTK